MAQRRCQSRPPSKNGRSRSRSRPRPDAAPEEQGIVIPYEQERDGEPLGYYDERIQRSEVAAYEQDRRDRHAEYRQAAGNRDLQIRLSMNDHANFLMQVRKLVNTSSNPVEGRRQLMDFLCRTAMEPLVGEMELREMDRERLDRVVMQHKVEQPLDHHWLWSDQHVAASSTGMLQWPRWVDPPGGTSLHACSAVRVTVAIVVFAVCYRSRICIDAGVCIRQDCIGNAPRRIDAADPIWTSVLASSSEGRSSTNRM